MIVCGRIGARNKRIRNGADEYDLLVLKTLDRASPAEAPATRPVAIFVTPRGLISIRPAGDRVFEHAAIMQADIDSLVQVHYAAIGQRTNEILRRQRETSLGIRPSAARRASTSDRLVG